MNLQHASILVLALSFANPLEECASKIQKEDKPAPKPPPTTAPAPPPPVTTTVKPGATTTPTSNKPGPKPTPNPTPGPTPGPTPSPSPSPSPSPTPPAPSGQLVFYAETGTDGGLYPHAAEWIAVARANGPSLRKCYVNANALTDLWSTKMKIVAQKRGPITFQLLVRKDQTAMADTTATAKAIEDCHRTALAAFPWPSTNEIEGLDGGLAYLNFYSGMQKPR